MVQILWHGGVEPPDVKKETGKGASIATYTGDMEETVEVEAAESESKQEQLATSESLDKLIARASEKLAKQTKGRARPAEEQTVHKPKQQRQVAPASKAVAPKTSVTARRASINTAGVYNLARKRRIDIGITEQPLIIAGDYQPLPVMMPLMTMDSSAAPEIVIEVAAEKPQPRRAEVIPIRFPLTDEQQKREEFYQQTGMTPADLRELLTPGWTIAGMLDPREHARRIRTGFWNRVYDVEYTVVKAKHTMRDFLYKKRPASEKALAPGKT